MNIVKARKLYPFAPDDKTLTRFVVMINIGTCLEWKGYKNEAGHGRFRWNGKLWLAHRVAYLWATGDLPEYGSGIELDHHCDNEACVRVGPRHVRELGRKANILRGQGACAQNARKTKCKHGHKFTPENTCWIRGGTARECRECRNARTLAAYHKRKGQ